MADYGRRKSDKMLLALEREIRQEYAKAAKEVEQKLTKHLDSFARKDKQKLSQLSKGLITQKEYEQWRVGQVMIGKRWEKLTKDLTAVMNNADKAAAAMMDGMIDRYEAELGVKTKVIATGGLAGAITPYCTHEITVDDGLLMRGLAVIWEKNAK